jgi:hypothetical protein
MLVLCGKLQFYIYKYMFLWNSSQSIYYYYIIVCQHITNFASIPQSTALSRVIDRFFTNNLPTHFSYQVMHLYALFEIANRIYLTAMTLQGYSVGHLIQSWNEGLVGHVFEEGTAQQILNAPLFPQVNDDRLVWKSEKNR